MGDPLLRADGVCVSFGGLDVLTDVSIDVAATGVLGVIGPNGAGKTTLFNVICGFVRARTGSMTFNDRPLHHARPHDMATLGIARTLQGLGLFGRLTVLENVIAGTTHLSRHGAIAGLLGSPWADRTERRLRAKAMDVMRSLDIAQDAHRGCASLPYGVRKRVALARALVSEPRLLLLDEPAAGLSAQEMTELADLIRRLHDSTSVMLVEHNMDFVMDLCDRLVVLDFGQVIARGSPNDVRQDANVQRAYLGETVATAETVDTADTAKVVVTPMLEVTGLRVHYGAVCALDDVDLHVAEGSITAVLGANGAGKTTLLRAISGLVKAAGDIRFVDRRILGRAPETVVRQGIAHVPEGRGVIAELTVEENLRLGGLWLRDRGWSREGVRRMVELFPPLAAARSRRAETLSGGERQMLAVARALMSRPKLLLLDEPSLGLAPLVVADIIATLRGLRDRTGLTILLVEQNAATALSVADRAVVLNLGRKVADDEAENLLADNRVRHAYLGM